MQYSASGFAPLTITMRAINQALCSACQLSSPEYYKFLLYRPFYSVIKEWSRLEGCVFTVGKSLCSYIEILSGFICLYSFSLSQRDCLFDKAKWTVCLLCYLSHIRMDTLGTKTDTTQTLTCSRVHIQSSDSR